jgi:hypothetical protein
MLYRVIIAVCSQIHTKHINTLCGQNVELLNVKLAVHIVTTGLMSLTSCCTVRFTSVIDAHEKYKPKRIRLHALRLGVTGMENVS